MSMNFDRPLTEGQQDIVRKLMGGDLVALDEKTALFNSSVIDRRKMTTIANETSQPVTVELNEPGEIKTMADGSRYRVTPDGWVKL